jgi:hypothetical protein
MLLTLIALTLVTCADLVTWLNCDIGNFGNDGIATLVTKVTSKKMVILVINMAMNVQGLLFSSILTKILTSREVLVEVFTACSDANMCVGKRVASEVQTDRHYGALLYERI